MHPECLICGVAMAAHTTENGGICGAHNPSERRLWAHNVLLKQQLEQQHHRVTERANTALALGTEVMSFRFAMLEVRGLAQAGIKDDAPEWLEALESIEKMANEVIQKPISAFEQEASFASVAAQVTRDELKVLELRVQRALLALAGSHSNACQHGDSSHCLACELTQDLRRAA